ncbi:hypothetical protein ACFOYW_09785 [Gryllotalpicola reticulitermitis]|uniref:LPXTG-motif cell wall anchor domain-containing protein n=1 Tax=Gryllotalpicola reticulitermitis TaxID=1184153 RepID=A0ABV8Q7M8_9MICO
MPALLRTAAVAAAATVLAVATPLAAQAASPAPYAPSKQASWSAAVCAGGTLHHQLPTGTFGASRALLETVTGTGDDAALPGVFLAAQTSYSLTSTARGAATVDLTFPTSAVGSYDVSLAQLGGGATSYGAVTVNTPGSTECPVVAAADSPPDSPVKLSADAPADPPPAAATTQLAATGSTVNAGVVWGAGGAIILGAAATLVFGRRRQPRRR